VAVALRFATGTGLDPARGAGGRNELSN
jgi:hypothetical protein